MDSKLSRWCEGLIEAGLLAAVITAPLFFNIHSDRVFEPDKLTLVRSIALLVAIAWLVRFIDGQGWENVDWLRWNNETSIWRMPFVMPVFLIVISYLISTIFSVVPRVSWAGSYQRLQGTYSTLSYIVLFAVAVSTYRRRGQISRLVTAVIVSSIPVALYGILQHFGLDPLPWGGNVQRRVAGHMGNAIFIAAYLIMAVPLTVSRIIDAFTNILSDEELSSADVVRSSVYIFTLAIQLVTIYWSGSRGPLLGLLVGMFAFVLILLVSLRNAEIEQRRFGLQDAGRAVALVVIGVSAGYALLLLLMNALSGRVDALGGAMPSFIAFVSAIGLTAVGLFVMVAARRGWRWLWMSWLVLAVVVAAWLGLFNVPQETAEPYLDTPIVGNVLTTMEEWRALPTVGRFGKLLEAEEGTGKVRVLIWEGALELYTPHEPLAFPDGEEDRFNVLRPLIGYGPESMYVAYNRFYLPELATVEARNASPDRSHNETLDALVITGALGFLIWQALYVSVFFFGFKWLGVVRSKRDRNVLIGMWIGGAIVGAIVITELLGIVFIGVAIPFGSIIGLVLYLIYYALIASSGVEEDAQDPFRVDRLLMMGLLAAVLAHYVEIHFGIAIAATRVHFFVYIALMFLVGYLLPGIKKGTIELAKAPAPTRSRRSRRRRTSTTGPGWVGSVLAATFVMTLVTGIMGYEFMNYVRPDDLQVQTLADVPPAGEIFHQALFVNASNNFADSPFIFLMITMTWLLGTLLFLSEMAKRGVIQVGGATTGRVDENQTRASAIIFIGLMVGGLLLRFLPNAPETILGTTRLLGQGLLLIWAALCLWAAFRLLQGHDSGRLTGSIIAMVGLVMSLPTIVAGAQAFGFALLVGTGIILYLLWDRNWTALLLPAGLISTIAYALGLFYAYLQAAQIRSAVFIGPDQQVTGVERLIFTTDQFARFLTVFYIFAIGLLLTAAFFFAQSRMANARKFGSAPAFATLAVLLVLAVVLINGTNLRIIQADIVYKQGKPLDQVATRNRDAGVWDQAIAIYEHAIDLAPKEDFYYLFLGRAYLEKSAVTQDPAEQEQMLETARSRLLRAQEINPLNTDHTANLARLHTRWATLQPNNSAERADLIQTAEDYYQEALDLSPQNSIIRNEYANLLVTFGNDCEAGIDTYRKSLEIDPFYADTYFNLAGTYEFCANQVAAEQKDDYYREAAILLKEGLERRNRNAATYLVQAGQLYRQAGDYEQALAALEEARQQPAAEVPGWQIDFQFAAVYRDMGDVAMARRLAERALAAASQDARPQIQQFLDRLGQQ